MKTSMSKFFASLLTFLTAVLFVLSLATAYLYFSVYNAENFTDTVGSFIDGEIIKKDAGKSIEIISKNYGFDTAAAAKVNDSIDFKALGSEYFEKFYKAFISGSKEVKSSFTTFDNIARIIGEALL